MVSTSPDTICFVFCCNLSIMAWNVCAHALFVYCLCLCTERLSKNNSLRELNCQLVMLWHWTISISLTLTVNAISNRFEEWRLRPPTGRRDCSGHVMVSWVPEVNSYCRRITSECGSSNHALRRPQSYPRAPCSYIDQYQSLKQTYPAHSQYLCESIGIHDWTVEP